MNIIDKNLPVSMVQVNMYKFPVYPIPETYTIRFYRPGDEKNWLDIQRGADKFNQIDANLFDETFGTDKEILVQRILFLCNSENKTIGTAAAWFNDYYHGDKYGRVHWVAIHPDFQWKGLSKPLLSTTCQRIRDFGNNKCYLTTSSARIAAINLYLNFGFIPEVSNSKDESIWNSLKQHCNF
jgi:GNAT superfamily N-acetyltransferase